MKKALTQFILFFREERFFEANEILEELWRESEGKEKMFYQGLIQLAVAYHHAQNKNWKGACYEYSLSKEKLKKYLPEYFGVNVKNY